jgi:ubiquinone biosynthesis O-methyltransferase
MPNRKEFAMQSTIDPAEVAKFEAMAAEWWDPQGKFKPLHMLNPCRLDYITSQIAAEFDRDISAPKPFAGLRILDIGCGMGWRTTNHFRNGWSAYGCDVSDWAYFNSVLPLGRHFCCDMRDLPRRVKRSFQVVSVERSIEYLPQDEAVKALDSIDAVATDYVVTSIICTEITRAPAS